MKLNPDLPTPGIMTTAVYPDARSFRVACDCHDSDHDVDVWIEVESDHDVREVTITFYRELDTPWWEPGFNRFREAWQILRHGRSRFSGTLIVREQTAQTLCDAIQSSIRILRDRT
jgi:hypothetical protein